MLINLFAIKNRRKSGCWDKKALNSGISWHEKSPSIFIYYTKCLFPLPPALQKVQIK